MNLEKLKQRAKKHNIVLDEDNRAILKMKVSDDSSFYLPIILMNLLFLVKLKIIFIHIR